jgi:hypothetical protein
MFSIHQHDPPRIPFEKFYLVARALNGPEDFSNPTAAAAIQMFVDEGSLPVWLSFAGNKQLIHPNPELASAILNPATAPEHLRPSVMEWRARLGLA